MINTPKINQIQLFKLNILAFNRNTIIALTNYLPAEPKKQIKDNSYSKFIFLLLKMSFTLKIRHNKNYSCVSSTDHNA